MYPSSLSPDPSGGGPEPAEGTDNKDGDDLSPDHAIEGVSSSMGIERSERDAADWCEGYPAGEREGEGAGLEGRRWTTAADFLKMVTVWS